MQWEDVDEDGGDDIDGDYHYDRGNDADDDDGDDERMAMVHMAMMVF